MAGKTAILSIRIVSNASDAERGIDRTNRNLRKLGDNSDHAGVKLARMYQKLDGAARVATRVGAVSTAIQALTVKGASAARAVAPLAGLLAGLPGVAAAGGAAFATWKTATAGFGDALASAGTDAKKFAEATRNMPPAMVQAVLATKRLTTAFQDVQKAVQASFWKGIAGDIDNLGRRVMPALKAGMVGVAGASNGMVRELLRAASTGPALSAIHEAFALAERAIGGLTPAVGPLVDGIARIVGASAKMLGGFDGAAGAARRFQGWAKRITSDGTLQRWFQGGKDAAGQLGRALGGVGRIIGGIAKAAADASGPGTGLQGFADAVNRIADAIMRPEIQSQLTESFRRSSEIANAVTSVIVALLPLLAEFGPELLLIGAAWKFVSTMMALYRGAMILATTAQAIFNGVAALNPIGLIALAIIAVIAAVVLLYYKCEWFRKAVDAVARAVKDAFVTAWNWIVEKAGQAVAWVKQAWGTVSGAVRTVVGAVKTAWAVGLAYVTAKFNQAKAAGERVWNAIKGAASRAGTGISTAIGGAIRYISGIWGGITRAASAAFQRVVDAAYWAAGAVSRALAWITSQASRVSSWVSGLFGSGGMWQKVTVQSTLPDQGQPFYLHAAGLVSSPTRWSAGRSSTVGDVINVTVTGAIDPNETARQIKRILNRDSKRDGNQWIGAPAW